MDQHTRDQTILSLMPVVHSIARKHCPKFKGARVLFHYEDLVSAGTIGLISAVDNYSASMGACVRTYANTRILGAIQDYHRSQDHATRDDRKFARQKDEAVASLKASLARDPEESEIIATMDIPEWKYNKYSCRDLHSNVELDAKDNATIADTSIPDPLADLTKSQALCLADQLRRNLGHTDGLVYDLYYLQGFSVRQISHKLGITASGVWHYLYKTNVRLRRLAA